MLTWYCHGSQGKHWPLPCRILCPRLLALTKWQHTWLESKEAWMEVSVMSYMSQKKYSHLSLLLDAGDASRDVLAVASGWRLLSLHADVLWGSFVTDERTRKDVCKEARGGCNHRLLKWTPAIIFSVTAENHAFISRWVMSCNQGSIW